MREIPAKLPPNIGKPPGGGGRPNGPPPIVLTIKKLEEEIEALPTGSPLRLEKEQELAHLIAGRSAGGPRPRGGPVGFPNNPAFQGMRLPPGGLAR